MVYHNEPTHVGEGTLMAPDYFLYTTVEFILRNQFITYEGEDDRRSIRQFSPNKTNYTKGDEAFWNTVLDGKECVYFPYCVSNVDECGDTKRGLCKEVNNGNAVMPNTRNELFAVLKKGKRLVQRFRLKEKKANMKPPPPSSSSSGGVIIDTKNDVKDGMSDTIISIEAQEETKEKGIGLNDINLMDHSSTKTTETDMIDSEFKEMVVSKSIVVLATSKSTDKDKEIIVTDNQPK